MTELQERIVKYVTASNALVSLEKLTAVAGKVGYSEGQVLEALSGIGKRLKSTVRANTVYYQVPPAPKLYTPPPQPPYPYPPECLHCHGALCAQCFPFYDPERDTIEGIRERNRELNRHYAKEKAERGRHTARNSTLLKK